MLERGQIWIADLGVNVGSVQSRVRPVVIMQNNVANKYSPTVNVIPFTSNNTKKLPPHYTLHNSCLDKSSTVLTESITTISVKQLIRYKGIIEERDLKEIERKLVTQLGISYGTDNFGWHNV